MDPVDLQADRDIVGRLRRAGAPYGAKFPIVPDEYTHWLDEHRAALESCTLGDLSHHMTTMHVRGPDAIDLFRDLSVNSFEEFGVGQAKQVVCCSPQGYVMGDGPLLRLGEEEFWAVPTCAEWIQYHIETGGYDLTADVDPPTSAQPGDPDWYIYQVQGPDALDVLGELTDAALADVGFYRFEEVDLAGHRVRVFGHGMNTEAGFELHGPFEEADAVRAAILEAGEPYGIRRLGTKAYNTQSLRIGWLGPAVPPIYDVDGMAGFREWLDPESREANTSIGGSFDSDDVTDYYISPLELGYGKLIAFDHEFVGRSALEAAVESQERTLVTLQWDDDDVVDVYASLFREGRPNRFMTLPRIGHASRAYDSVTAGGDPVGISHSRSYEHDVRSVVSLARIDLDHADPGTEVTVHWGRRGGSPSPAVEDHEPAEISATVRPVPYARDYRKAGTAGG